jgi:hypothetical protein
MKIVWNSFIHKFMHLKHKYNVLKTWRLSCLGIFGLENLVKKIMNYSSVSHPCASLDNLCVATPLWDKCEDETHTPKNGKLESSGTPKNSELDWRGHNTLHWGVFYINGKVLKCKCPKWPCMIHLDISSPSYGQKKGRESNWQFDSRPLKVRNRPESDVCKRSATWRWKAQRDLQDCFRPHPNRRSEQKVMVTQSPGSANWDSFGTPLWESREKVPFGCSLGGELQRILYGRKWWLPPSPGHGESSESKLPVACPNTKGVPKCELTHLWLVLDVGLCNKIIVPLPSLILEFLTRPSHPL